MIETDDGCIGSSQDAGEAGAGVDAVGLTLGAALAVLVLLALLLLLRGC